VTDLHLHLKSVGFEADNCTLGMALAPE
jgi:hypothetical protein